MKVSNFTTLTSYTQWTTWVDEIRANKETNELEQVIEPTVQINTYLDAS
jgi:hypothetical protein